GSFYLYVEIPTGTADGQTFATAEAFSQWLISEQQISTVPWDEAGHFVRFSATFVSQGAADEQRVLDEVKRRLGGSQFIFA
ncbi:MAG: LL-diaminopimelate aminotransferase, partial [bacterium]